jgi:hypothetical protein
LRLEVDLYEDTRSEVRLEEGRVRGVDDEEAEENGDCVRWTFLFEYVQPTKSG